MDLTKLFELQGKLDGETLVLLGRFITRALKQPDTNQWLKDQLRFILDPPSAPGPIHVEVRPCPPKRK